MGETGELIFGLKTRVKELEVTLGEYRLAFMKVNDYQGAGKIAESLKWYDEAASDYCQDTDFASAGRVAEKAGLINDACVYYARAGLGKKADELSAKYDAVHAQMSEIKPIPQDLTKGCINGRTEHECHRAKVKLAIENGLYFDAIELESELGFDMKALIIAKEHGLTVQAKKLEERLGIK